MLRTVSLVFAMVWVVLGVPQPGQAEILVGRGAAGNPGPLRSVLLGPLRGGAAVRAEFTSSAWDADGTRSPVERAPQYTLPDWSPELGDRLGSLTDVSAVPARDYRRPARGVLIDLGTLGGATSEATSINTAGQVAGYSETKSGAKHAFRWDPQQRRMRDLGTLGGNDSYAQGINDRGDVVGYSETADGDVHAFVWTSDDATMHDLGTLGGQHSRAAAINNRGVVVGFAQTVEQADHAFVWDPTHRTMRDLGTFGGRSSYAFDVNDAGLVVGHAQHEDGVVQAFRWTAVAEQLQPIASLDGLLSYAFAVSARGDVSGYALRDSGRYHGFVTELSQRAVDLGTFPDDFTRAYRLERDGRFRGYDAAPHGPNYAVRWNPATGRLQDHSAIGTQLAVAWDINARGTVVGAAQSSDRVVRAAMWQPATEGEGESGWSDGCGCGCELAAEPALPAPFSTDVGYQLGAVGMPGASGGGGGSPGTFAATGGGPSGYVGGGGGGFWGGGGGGGGGFRGGGGGGSFPGGGEGEVPEPTSVALWLSALLAAAGGRWVGRRRARRV